jgi:hypothetical protein
VVSTQSTTRYPLSIFFFFFFFWQQLETNVRQWGDVGGDDMNKVFREGKKRGDGRDEAQAQA